MSDLFRNFQQLGYVTDDIDAAASYLESRLGTVECIKHYRSALVGGDKDPGSGGSDFVVVDGEPADEWVIDVALVNAGRTNLEIIRPVSGSVDLYRDAIRPGEPATLHHLGFLVDDFDEASAIVAAGGRSWKQFGDSGGLRFGYLDMRAELGHFVEIMELGETGTKTFAHLEALSNAGLEPGKDNS
ncbi:VOC family protein [Actinocorallia herbida]|uniref:VOC family protein n=1 Tax=Actinocorallia herbida TaxID=58109 RepID=UPI001B8698CB|nr:VOC family protein [Actinocorallia herbida]